MGADIAAAAAGDDLVCGGDDNDSRTGASGNDLYGENGADLAAPAASTRWTEEMATTR
jgi:hypothetical protein